jgi:Domain of unknown function (DUF4873)
MTGMDEVDYAGPATVLVDEQEVPVRVRLIAVNEPVDGRIHWSGRVEADQTLHEVLGGSTSAIELVTASGRAPGKVGEPDLWGRYRVTGVGPPPFTPDPPPLDG